MFMLLALEATSIAPSFLGEADNKHMEPPSQIQHRVASWRPDAQGRPHRPYGTWVATLVATGTPLNPERLETQRHKTQGKERQTRETERPRDSETPTETQKPRDSKIPRN